MSIRYDRALVRATKNEDGFIHDTPVLTRTGVFVYLKPDGSERREYRPAAQVVVNQGRKQAALAHLGITQVSLPLVADELAHGALVEVLPACALQYPPLYAYYPNRKGHASALLQVLAAIREG